MKKDLLHWQGFLPKEYHVEQIGLGPGASEKIVVTLPGGIKVLTAMPVDLRGETIGEPIKIMEGKFEFELSAYEPASFILL